MSFEDLSAHSQLSPGNMANTTEPYHLNDTDLEEAEEEIFHDEMVKAHMLTVPLGLIALYIIGSQIAYLILRKNRNKITNIPRCYTAEDAKESERHAYIISLLCIIAAFTAFLRVGIDLRLIYGVHDNFGCDISIKFKVVQYASSLFAIYLVLWMRQRLFYRDPRLKHLSSKFIQTLSWNMGFILLASGLVAIGIFLLGVRYKATSVGCRTIPGPLNKTRWIVLGTGTVLFQICFLCLFLYPLGKHQQDMKRFGRTQGQGNPVIKLVKRATVITIICILTDMVTVAVILFIDKNGMQSTRIYGINLVINVVCLIFSFPDWRERLMPWIMLKEIEREIAVIVISRNGTETLGQVEPL